MRSWSQFLLAMKTRFQLITDFRSRQAHLESINIIDHWVVSCFTENTIIRTSFPTNEFQKRIQLQLKNSQTGSK